MTWRTLALTAILAIHAPTYAQCEYPAPDTGGGSPPSLVGIVVRIEKAAFTVRDSKNRKLYIVSLAGIQSIFTAFGGDGKPKDLRPGLAVRVWTKRCTPVSLERINAAGFVQVFSFSPEDPAPESFFK